MATVFSGTFKINLTGSLEKDNTLGDPTKLPVSFSYSKSFTNGGGADQANMIYKEKLTISGSGSTDLDLAGGLTNAFGDSITFTEIKLIILRAAAANGDNISVGGDASAALDTIFADTSDELILRPDGCIVLAAPDATAYVVTGTTADILELTNLDSSDVDVDVIIVGSV